MLLSARMLNNVSDANSFEYGTQSRFMEGDTPYVYFQLIDVNKDGNLKPQGRRYAPTAVATLTVVIKNVDDSKTLTKTATQPFTNDGSIWRFQVSSSDALRGTYSFKLTLTENSGATTTYGYVTNALSVVPQSGILL